MCETSSVPGPTYALESSNGSYAVEHEAGLRDAERIARVVVRVPDRDESSVLTQLQSRSAAVPVTEDIAFWTIPALPPGPVRRLAGVADMGEAAPRLSRLAKPPRSPWSTAGETNRCRD